MGIKYQWFLSFCLLVGWIYYLVLSSFSSYEELLYYTLGIAIFAGVTFYFSFLKRGFQWLLWIMILLPIIILVNLGDTIQSFKGEMFDWFYFSVNFLVGFVFWINCFRFRRDNIAYQRKLEEEEQLEIERKRKELEKEYQMPVDEMYFHEARDEMGSRFYRVIYRISVVLGVLLVFPVIVFSLGELFGSSEIVQGIQIFMIGVLVLAIPIVLILMINWIKEGFFND